jgi:hypothetical protein
MPPRQPRSRALLVAATWPVGVTLTSWSYLWRTTPMHRSEEAGRLPDDAPPPLADGISRDELQGPAEGVGPLFHRVYQARIRNARHDPESLVQAIAGDLNRVAPTEFARFVKTTGARDELAGGDEFLVRMPGRWAGPVRVVVRPPASFRLATLAGHLEAGQIEFRARGDGQVVFEIESWARSGDRLSNLLYSRLRMAKEVQLHMWTSVLERVARLSGGRLDGGLTIRTRRIPAEDVGELGRS